MIWNNNDAREGWGEPFMFDVLVSSGSVFRMFLGTAAFFVAGIAVLAVRLVRQHQYQTQLRRRIKEIAAETPQLTLIKTGKTQGRHAQRSASAGGVSAEKSQAA
jgi:hypothetical protein